MGIFLSCCGGGGSSSYHDMDSDLDAETRRRQMAEAAENRLKAQEGRGIRDPAALKQRQKRMEEIERKQEMTEGNEGGLRWQVG
ncbi:uncharacterized protein LOC125027196 [Penaeus chinensis]|uniref:uncharacterized protein LOC125027196 n=1 Tax=Penaeus chinensis TaxID=139456 RepID=UPI001FB57106|nr:uncharacterized protein LOC125027196 [Penaeus chinensis]